MAIHKPGPVIWSASAARRIKAAVRRVELRSASHDRRPGRADTWTRSVVRARVTTKITAGTFHSPGTGAARIYWPDAAGVWRPSGDPVAVKNQSKGDEVAVPDAILIAWISGEWWLLDANCSDKVDASEDPEPEAPGGGEGGGGPVEDPPGDPGGLGD